MGKESEKAYIHIIYIIHIYIHTHTHMYILSHFAVHLKLTQHCKSTILQLKKKKKRQSTDGRQ